MVFGQNDQKFILFQKDCFKFRPGRQAQKTEIDASFGDPILTFGIIAQQNLKFDIWIRFAKDF